MRRRMLGNPSPAAYVSRIDTSAPPHGRGRGRDVRRHRPRDDGAGVARDGKDRLACGAGRVPCGQAPTADRGGSAQVGSTEHISRPIGVGTTDPLAHRPCPSAGRTPVASHVTPNERSQSPALPPTWRAAWRHPSPTPSSHACPCAAFCRIRSLRP